MASTSDQVLPASALATLCKPGEANFQKGVEPCSCDKPDGDGNASASPEDTATPLFSSDILFAPSLSPVTVAQSDIGGVAPSPPAPSAVPLSFDATNQLWTLQPSVRVGSMPSTLAEAEASLGPPSFGSRFHRQSFATWLEDSPPDSPGGSPSASAGGAQPHAQHLLQQITRQGSLLSR